MAFLLIFLLPLFVDADLEPDFEPDLAAQKIANIVIYFRQQWLGLEVAHARSLCRLIIDAILLELTFAMGPIFPSGSCATFVLMMMVTVNFRLCLDVSLLQGADVCIATAGVVRVKFL